MRRIVCDIECNGLLDTLNRIWCAVTHDLDTGEVRIFSDYTDQIVDGGTNDFITYLKTCDQVVGHNFIGYDKEAIFQVTGYWMEAEIIDTMLLSKLLHFTRYQPKGAKSKHSLEAWGIRTGVAKPKQEQWKEWEESMLNRCTEDVKINVETYHVLSKEIAQQPRIKKAIRLEHEVARVTAEQVRNGWLVDVDKINENIKYLDEEIERLRLKIEPQIPLKCTPKDSRVTWEECNEMLGNIWKKVPATRLDHLQRPIKLSRKPSFPKVLKDGRYDKFTALWFGIKQEDGQGERMVVGPYSKIEFKVVKLSQHGLIKDWLLTIGWKPTQWTYKKGRDGKLLKDERNRPLKNAPRITQDSFESIPGEIGEDLGRWATLVHRRNTLENPKDNTKGWKNIRRDDGRVVCDPDTLGAATGRMTHRGLVNVPGTRALFGKEMRQCFIAPKGKVLIGADAAGAQLRLLAAAMGDKGYLKTVVSGEEEDEEGNFVGTDVHTQNGLAAGLINQSDVDWLRSHVHTDTGYGAVHDRFVGARGAAKNFIYGLLFGAGAPKMGLLVGGGAKEGQEMKDKFLAGFPKLKELLNTLDEEFEHNKANHKEGFIRGLDGRRVYVDSKHKLLNYLLQGNEAVYIKLAVVIADRLFKKNNVDIKLLTIMHDECNYEVDPKQIGAASKILSHAFKIAGEKLGLVCEMATDPKVGETWYDIH